MEHTKAIQAKMAQQQPKGNPGVPGGVQQQNPPGVAGSPRPGSVPAGPKQGAQQPPGAVHQDQMADGQAGMRG